jgi:DNA-directed RNA polymerase specialized sigma24 family protein
MNEDVRKEDLRDDELPETPDNLKRWLAARLQDFRDRNHPDHQYVWAQFEQMTTKVLTAFATHHCYGNLRKEDALDIVQATYLIAWKERERINIGPKDNPFGWLCTVCYRVTVDLVRKRDVAGRNWSSLDTPAGASEGSTRTIGDGIEDYREQPPGAERRNAEFVAQLLARLTAEEKWIMVHYHIVGVDAASLARKMGTSAPALRARIHRIHLKLRETPPAGLE